MGKRSPHISVENPERKLQLVKRRRRWNCNIKIEFKKKYFKAVD
jgi:hypothetical protein